MAESVSERMCMMDIDEVRMRSRGRNYGVQRAMLRGAHVQRVRRDGGEAEC